MSDPAPSLPPLFDGEASATPFATAIARARAGTEPGLLAYDIRPDRLTAALVLGPEVPLEDAMAMVLAAANGFGDAFGALAPSEVACQFDWPGGLRINGARCGGLRAAASTRDPEAEPDWLVVGIEVPFFAPAEAEPGETPDRTTLWEEGCGDIEPARLLESWSRHSLVWIHEWLEAGIARLHRDWLGRAAGRGEDITVELPDGVLRGEFTGLDERGGLLLKVDGAVRLLPLSRMLEDSA